MKRTTVFLTVCLCVLLLPLALPAEAAIRSEVRLSKGLQAPQAAPEGSPAAPQAAKAPQWKSREEYDAFQAIMKASDSQAKVQAADAFLQKYPTSDFKAAADYLKMQAYQHLNQVGEATTAANAALKANPPDRIKVEALNYLCYVFPYVYKPNSPGGSAQLSQIQDQAKEGLQLLQQVQKPANIPQAQFEKGIAQIRSNFNRAQGFAALQQKDYNNAITYLKAAAEDTPNDGYIASFLGQAYLFMKPVDYNDALWYLARAVSLAQKANTPNLSGVKQLYSQWYQFRHGSDAGQEQLVAQAGGSVNPPSGFNVSTPPKHAKTGNTNADAIYGIQDALSVGGSATQTAWNQYKGQALGLVGFVEGASKGPDRGTYDVKTNVLPNSRGQAGIYQLELITNQSDAQYLELGDPIHFKGNISAYTMTPNFVLTVTDAQIDPQSLRMASDRAKAKAQQEAQHHGRK